MSEYEEGYYDSQNRFGGNQNRSFQNGQAVGSLVGVVLGGLLRLVPVVLPLLIKAAPFSPFVVLGLAVGSWLPVLGGTAHLVVGLGLAYVLGQLLYYLKGLGKGMRVRGELAGLLVLGLFVIGACIVPALALYRYILGVQLVADVPLALALAGVLAVFAFLTTCPWRDYAPALGLWSYRQGYQAAGK